MNFQEVYKKSQEDYIIRTPNSQKAYNSAKRYMPGGETRTTVYYSPYPLTIERGSGPYLFDADGNRYIDFLNNYTSMIHGHAHPLIVEKAQAILSLGTAYASAVPEQIELAQILCERIPSIDRVRFCNSGTEATMFTIRAARAYTGKTAIIKMEGGYHGSHDLVEYSVSPALPHSPDNHTWKPVPDFPGLSSNVARDLYIAPFNQADAVEEILISKADEIAAILVEPVMGVAGVIPPRQGYLGQLRKLADKYNVLLIFDEVQTLRFDMGGAQKKYNVLPDLTAMGKIIGGGFPVGAFGGRQDIMSIFDPGNIGFLSHGGTFNGNRITMAAGKASMELLNQDSIQSLDNLADYLESMMKESIEKFQMPISITRVASMLNVHFVKQSPFDYASTFSPYKDFVKIMHIKLLNHGIFIAPRGMLNLSTVMTKGDMDEAGKAFAEVLQEMADLFE